MRMNWNIVSVLAVAAAAFVVGRAGAPTGAGSAALAAGQPEGELPPELAAMMVAGTPGEQHEKLNTLVGDFAFTGKLWMGEGDEPFEMNGSVRREWILDGRYIRENVRASSEMGSFEGVGFTGYNNHDGQYEMAWMDDHSTEIYMEAGSFDDATKVLTTRGSRREAAGGKLVHSRGQFDLSDPDRHTYIAYETGTDGHERKAFEMVFTRR